MTMVGGSKFVSGHQMVVNVSRTNPQKNGEKKNDRWGRSSCRDGRTTVILLHGVRSQQRRDRTDIPGSLIPGAGNWATLDDVLLRPPALRPQAFPVRQQDQPRREPGAAHARQHHARVPYTQRGIQRHRQAREHRRRDIPHGNVGSEDRGRSGGVEIDIVIEQGELYQRHPHAHGDT